MSNDQCWALAHWSFIGHSGLVIGHSFGFLVASFFPPLLLFRSLTQHINMACMFLAFSLDALSSGIDAWAASMGQTGEALLRLVLAGAAGGLVGLEREVRGRLAGFRTNLLVCMGSALVMLVSIHVAYAGWGPSTSYDIQVDPARIAYGVMTGIGFLGAGTIMQARGAIRGLTTAAALWCVAAVGLGIGLGFYVVSILGAALVVLALWILDYLEAFIPKKRFRRITVRREWCDGCVPKTINRMQALRFDIDSVTFERVAPDLKQVDITLAVSYIRREQFDTLEHDLRGDGGLELIAAKE
jgi:putative Mg2+ transporter-C (MgtC) family protein